MCSGYLFGFGARFLQTVLELYTVFVSFNTVVTVIVPALVLLAYESPRWYVAHGQLNEAYNSLLLLHNPDILAARELCRICSRVGRQRSASGLKTTLLRFAELFTDAKMRRITLASSAVMVAGGLGMSSMTCIFYLMKNYLAPDTRDTLSIQPFFIAMYIAMTYASTVSQRRRLYLWSLFLLSFFLFLIRILFDVVPGFVQIILCFAFTMACAAGPGLIPFFYVAEIFPPLYRGKSSVIGMQPQC
jgi:hypothetical protein